MSWSPIVVGSAGCGKCQISDSKFRFFRCSSARRRSVVSKSPRPELLSSGLGKRWAIEHVYVKGREIELSNKQTKLYDKYMGRP